MNANEVIANRAIELAGRRSLCRREADPSERSRQHGAEHERHVSRRRSTWPWRSKSRSDLIPALERFRDVLAEKAEAVGQDHQDRPHAPDGRDAAAAGPGVRRLCPATRAVRRAGRAGIAGGAGTAGRRHGRRLAASTRIPNSAAASPRCLAEETGIPFVEAVNHFEANAQRDGLVECHGQSARRSPPRCSTWPTTFAGSASGRGAGSTK